ncbi:MAG: outer membrane beta-barrel protein [Saprospiraceae bacterium]|nr:outer membrane beta-barrel protein [Saprospiraceae bacterium]
MNKLVRFYFKVLVLSLLCTNLFGQQGFELGGWIGGAFYFGDLNTQFDVTHPGPAFGGIARYNFNNRLCARLGINYGFLRADDANSDNAFEQRRNINFRTHLGDVSGHFEFNFFPYIHGSRDYFYTPYLFAGASLFTYNPYAVYHGEKTPPLRELGTEGQFIGEEYPSLQRALNYGGGLKFDITDEWSINVEVSFRKVFTDYLDDVSTVYPDKGELKGNRPGVGDIAVLASDPSLQDSEGNLCGMEGRQRGDGAKKDSYNFLSIGLVYYFGNLKCPEISR